jgi:hypothetical protein
VVQGMMDPAAMQQMMQSPLMQQLLSNPELMRNMLQMNPAVREVRRAAVNSSWHSLCLPPALFWSTKMLPCFLR